jgi:hypothetical protein
MRPRGNHGRHDPDLCACGCGMPVAYDGLEPRFALGACRTRWVAQWAIGPDAGPAAMALDTRPQDPLPAADPVAVEEVAEVRAEFAQRVAVAPQVEAVREASPSGMWVQPGPRSLMRLLRGLARRVW